MSELFMKYGDAKFKVKEKKKPDKKKPTPEEIEAVQAMIRRRKKERG